MTHSVTYIHNRPCGAVKIWKWVIGQRPIRPVALDEPTRLQLMVRIHPGSHTQILGCASAVNTRSRSSIRYYGRRDSDARLPVGMSRGVRGLPGLAICVLFGALLPLRHNSAPSVIDRPAHLQSFSARAIRQLVSESLSVGRQQRCCHKLPLTMRPLRIMF